MVFVRLSVKSVSCLCHAVYCFIYHESGPKVFEPLLIDGGGPPKRKCVVEGCTKNPVKDRVCYRHLNADKTSRDPSFFNCQHDKCKTLIKSEGFCKVHANDVGDLELAMDEAAPTLEIAIKKAASYKVSEVNDDDNNCLNTETVSGEHPNGDSQIIAGQESTIDGGADYAMHPNGDYQFIEGHESTVGGGW